MTGDTERKLLIATGKRGPSVTKLRHAPSYWRNTKDRLGGFMNSISNLTKEASGLGLVTPGFASSLTREDPEDGSADNSSCVTDAVDTDITDEELALLGPPWSKEGLLSRKEYYDSAGKRSKDKKWMDVFVVAQKGQFSMFTFGDNNSNGDAPNDIDRSHGVINASPAGEYSLLHSTAHILPPDGFKKRPHCFVLSFEFGRMTFFQAGSEELAKEWELTCNYWAARRDLMLNMNPFSGVEGEESHVEPQSEEERLLQALKRRLASMDAELKEHKDSPDMSSDQVCFSCRCV